jgi:hypothetical protein
MGNRLVIIFCIFLFTQPLKGVLKLSTGNGDWTASGTWNPSGQPACGDSIIINAGHTVSVTSQVSYNGCATPVILVIRGTLYFEGGSKLRLSCGSKIYIFAGGRIDSDGAGNSNQLEVCGTTVWTGTSGPVNGPVCIPATLPGCNAVLPVTLALFHGQACNKDICLSWQTRSEINNDFFEVERSRDGILFVSIERVHTLANDGNSKMPINYSATDRKVHEGVFYYRIKQVDRDGTFEMSPVIIVQPTGIGLAQLEIFPNPARGKFTVTGTFLLGKPAASLCIYNSLSQLVLNCELSPEGTSAEVDLNNKLQPGSYVVRSCDSGITCHARLLIN